MNNNYIRNQIEHFLKEDIGSGDITSEAIFPDVQTTSAIMVAREPLVVCGFANIVPLVFSVLDDSVQCEEAIKDGSTVETGARLLTVTGNVHHLLLAERVALNLAQRLCGVATLTKKFVDAIAPLPVKIVDTRKTTPGLRIMEKYAVRTGGGNNHRFNLTDGVIIKDNHIEACGSIKKAVEAVRQRIPHTIKIEVEAETISQVEECLECGVEIIMLDNMGSDSIRQAVKLINGRALIEASGGVTLANVRQIAETGVDLISVGSLTHSAPAVDIGFDFLPG